MYLGLKLLHVPAHLKLSEVLTAMLGDVHCSMTSRVSSQCQGLVVSHVMTPAGMWHAQDTLDRIVPEGHHYRHLDEGLDDMPAHVKVGFFLQLCLHTDAAQCFSHEGTRSLADKVMAGGAVFPHGAKPEHPHSARKACPWNMAR